MTNRRARSRIPRVRGIYAERVFPRLVNRAMDTRQSRAVRARVCRELRGEVVEIGFGSGLNLPYLPVAVKRLRAVEPSGVAVRLAAERMRASPIPVEVASRDGQRLPFADDSADAVLMTWTMCSIPDPLAALSEIRRVLRPGGTLHFAEHGRSPDARVRAWQDRLNPVQRRIACGCNLNRDVEGLLAEGGMAVGRLDTYYVEGEPKLVGWTYEGTATPAQ